MALLHLPFEHGTHWLTMTLSKSAAAQTDISHLSREFDVVMRAAEFDLLKAKSCIRTLSAACATHKINPRKLTFLVDGKHCPIAHYCLMTLARRHSPMVFNRSAHQHHHLNDDQKANQQLDQAHLIALFECLNDEKIMVNISKPKHHRDTLILSIQAGYYDVAHFLIHQKDHPVNVHLCQPDCESALSLATRANQIELVKALIDLKAPLLHHPHAFGNVSHIAAKEGYLDLLRFFTEIGCELDHQDMNLRTPLHLAVEYDQTATVDFLIEQKVPLDAKDARLYSPLFIAVLEHNVDLSKKLIAAGADIIQQNSAGQSLLHLVDREDIASLLIEAGHPLNLKNKISFTPLHQHVMTASLYRNDKEAETDIISLLLKHGADPLIKTDDGLTPSAFAAGYGNKSLAIDMDNQILALQEKKQLSHLLPESVTTPSRKTLSL